MEIHKDRLNFVFDKEYFMEKNTRHQCFIYEGAPSQKIQVLARLLKDKLQEGYRCLYLNSNPMVAGMRSTLSALGTDVSFEVAKASLILSSEPVSAGKEFNGGVMLEKLDNILSQAISDGYKGLFATGDMTWEFGPERNFSKLLEYELGLEALFNRRNELCGVCQYHRDTLPPEVLRQSLMAHPSVMINETLSRLNPYYLKSAHYAEARETRHFLDKMVDDLCKGEDVGGKPDGRGEMVN